MPQSNYYAILEEVKQHIESVYKFHADSRFVYHDLTHTKSVVGAATQIANHYQLADKDFFIVVAASWFHDIGYFTDPPNHEEKGAEAAEEFLKLKEIENEVIDGVKGCIMATKWPQTAHNLLEEIVCDADLFHLGTDEFKEKNKLMRQEVELGFNKKIDKEQWCDKTVLFFKNHEYKTDYARLLLTDQKNKNIEKLKKKIEKEEKKQNKKEDKRTDEKPLLSLEKNDMKKNNKPELFDQNIKDKERPSKGIETMFRISSGNHQRLSDMADSKAHIMISTNSIIISILLSVLLRKLEDNPYLTIPVMILLAVCVITMVFSILATRPSIPEGTFTQTDVDNKTTNLLFFGNFYKMPLDAYTGGMQKMMNDREYLYGSMIKDGYSQGVVLGKKYKLLRISYNVFMYGIIISVLAFVVATLLGK